MEPAEEPTNFEEGQQDSVAPAPPAVSPVEAGTRSPPDKPTQGNGRAKKWTLGASLFGAAGGGVAAGAAAPAVITSGVGLAGFGSSGVAAGSFAAAVQGSSVASGSLFAACQSIGATGTLAYLGGASAAVVGGVAVVGAVVVGGGVLLGATLLSKHLKKTASSSVKGGDDKEELELDENAEQSFNEACIILSEAPLDIETAFLQLETSNRADDISWLALTASTLAPVLAQCLDTVTTPTCYQMVLSPKLLQGLNDGTMRLSRTTNLLNGIVMKANGIGGHALWEAVSLAGPMACLAASAAAAVLSLYQLHRLQCKLNEQEALVAQVIGILLREKLVNLKYVRSSVCELVRMMHKMHPSEFKTAYGSLRKELVTLYFSFEGELEHGIAEKNVTLMKFHFDALQMVVHLYTALQFLRVYYERLHDDRANRNEEEEEEAVTSFVLCEEDLRQRLRGRLLQLEQLAQTHTPSKGFFRLPSTKRKEEEFTKFKAWLQHKRKIKNKNTQKLPLFVTYNPSSSQLRFFPRPPPPPPSSSSS
ncbi:DUF697 domain-containing protein [Balamuthia mandrillaris]